MSLAAFTVLASATIANAQVLHYWLLDFTVHPDVPVEEGIAAVGFTAGVVTTRTTDNGKVVWMLGSGVNSGERGNITTALQAGELQLDYNYSTTLIFRNQGFGETDGKLEGKICQGDSSTNFDPETEADSNGMLDCSCFGETEVATLDPLYHSDSGSAGAGPWVTSNTSSITTYTGDWDSWTTTGAFTEHSWLCLKWSTESTANRILNAPYSQAQVGSGFGSFEVY